ncbi:MAG: BspA family leucine-rich repeat surface protein [Muribaculaceae bacterium]|nr:BspA family leucine-rich repeat surface protein [Muribaculaceae bacterium]
MNKKLLFRLVALMAAMMYALGASAAEAYACYTSSNTTLTFYYDNQRSSRSGRTYDLNTGSDDPVWAIGGEWGIGTSPHVTKVVFDPSFAGARPESTCSWFYEMENLESIEGMEYLNTSEVTNMSRMFNYCSKLTSLDLNRFNTSNVTDMERMFAECKALTSLDLGTFNTSKVTIMESMFDGNNNLRTIYVRSLWSTEAVRLSWRIFGDCYSLMGCRGTTYNSSNPQDKRYARIDGGPSEPGYFTLTGTTAYACYTSSNKTLTFYYDTDRVNRRGRTYDLNTIFNSPDWYYDDTNVDVTKVVIDPSFVGARPESTHGWFYEMSKLESITGLEYLNTSEVIDMRNMFAGCIQLTSLDVSGFNTSKVTDMQSLFDGCLFVTSLDLSSFNTSQVIDMDWMFRNCTNLRTIYVGDGWSTDRVTQSELMFLDCTSLVGGKGSTYNSSNPKDKTYARIDGGPSKPGYFTDKSAVLRGDVNGDGEVNIADVNALIDIILSGKGGTAAADVNGDGEVNIADVNALIDMILGGSWN